MPTKTLIGFVSTKSKSIHLQASFLLISSVDVKFESFDSYQKRFDALYIMFYYSVAEFYKLYISDLTGLLFVFAD